MHYYSIKVLLFLHLVDVILSSSSSLPDCQAHSIIFTEEPANVEVECGSDDVAVFPCRYEGTLALPQWIINSTEYSSLNSQLPPDHSYSDHTLRVTNLSTKNGSLYRCQLIFLMEGYPCVHRSSIGQLITRKCKVHAVQSFPYYYFGGSNIDRLMRIHTRIFQINESVGSYNITFYNSRTGKICGSDAIPTSSCTHGVCNHILNVSSFSDYPNSTDINVTVADSYENYLITDPIKIDGVNKFVKVSITSGPASEFSIISCRFMNQTERRDKSCAVSYGPVTPDCEDMSYYSEASVSESNSVTVGISSIKNSSNICFVVTASNGDKTVRVEGKYYNSDSVDKHHIQSAILLMSSVLTMIFILI